MKQYRVRIFTMLLGSGLFFSQCHTKETSNSDDNRDANQEMSSEYVEDHDDQADPSPLEATTEMPVIQDRTFQTLVTVYLDLNKAMVASDAEAARSIASRLLTTLANLDAENNLEAFKKEVNNILEADDLKQQRIHFAPLSQQFYQLVKANQGQQITLYKQHCPMALDGKGAFWLSDSKEIENPYYGEQMLTCGTVKETLAVNN